MALEETLNFPWVTVVLTVNYNNVLSCEEAQDIVVTVI